ncbi:hypothetical protein M8494_06730 [Serratia ureilytica]
MLTAERVRCSFSAAAAKLPPSATATKAGSALRSLFHLNASKLESMK